METGTEIKEGVEMKLNINDLAIWEYFVNENQFIKKLMEYEFDENLAKHLWKKFERRNSILNLYRKCDLKNQRKLEKLITDILIDPETEINREAIEKSERENF